MLFFVLAVSFPRYSNGLNGRGKKGWWKRKTMLKYVKNEAVHKRIAGGWDAALTGIRLSNKFLFIITEDADFSHKNYTMTKCKATSVCTSVFSQEKAKDNYRKPPVPPASSGRASMACSGPACMTACHTGRGHSKTLPLQHSVPLLGCPKRSPGSATICWIQLVLMWFSFWKA